MNYKNVKSKQSNSSQTILRIKMQLWSVGGYCGEQCSILKRRVFLFCYLYASVNKQQNMNHTGLKVHWFVAKVNFLFIFFERQFNICFCYCYRDIMSKMLCEDAIKYYTDERSHCFRWNITHTCHMTPWGNKQTK